MTSLLASLVVMSAAMPAKIEYPTSPKGTVVETLHGREIADPYRWLEDPNSAETKAWVEAQNKLTRSILDAVPGRQKAVDLMTRLINFERFSSPQKVGKHYLYSKNDGLQNQSVLYVTEKLDEDGRVLLDPNTLSKDGTVALAGVSASFDGKFLAYGLSEGGSDWIEWRVRNIDTGEDLKDTVKWSKFSGASWSKDNRGFYYSRYDAPKEGEALSGVNYFQKVYYHRLGTPQSEDVLVYENKDQKEWGYGATATEDGRYLVLSVWKGTFRENQIMVKDLRDKKSPGYAFREVRMGFDASYSYLGNDRNTFYFQTDKGAPNGRIVAIDIENPDDANWRTIVPEGKEAIRRQA